MLLILAQAAQTQDWVTPSVSVALITGAGALMRFLMSKMTEDMAKQKEQVSREFKELRREMYENARSLEKSIDFNTQATFMLTLGMTEIGEHLKAKVRTTEEQFRRFQSDKEEWVKAKEAQDRARGDKDERT